MRLGEHVRAIGLLAEAIAEILVDVIAMRVVVVVVVHTVLDDVFEVIALDCEDRAAIRSGGRVWVFQVVGEGGREPCEHGERRAHSKFFSVVDGLSLQQQQTRSEVQTDDLWTDYISTFGAHACVCCGFENTLLS